MSRFGLFPGLFGLVAALFSAPALAAEDAFVAKATADVMVNQGRGFVRASRIRAVRAGDQVMASETGSGWIIYCGCDVEVRPGKVRTVESRECKVESVNIRQPGLPHIVVQPDGQREEQEITRCRIPAAFLLGGAAAAGAYCIATECFDDNDDRRRSTSP
jgi:hypothetical protein